MYENVDVSSLNLIKLTRDDAFELIRASRASFVPYRKNPQQTIAGIFDRIFLETDYDSAKAVEILGFAVDSRPIAYVLLTMDDPKHSARVDYLYVDESMRLKGVGTKLIESTLKHVKQAGVISLYARTWSSNIACKKLFKKAGLTRERSTRLSDRVNGDHTIWYFG